MTAPGFSARDHLPAGHRWEPVSRGESGAAVFRRHDGTAYAKCRAGSAAPQLEAERDRIGWLAAQGIPGPMVLDWSAGEWGACLVTSSVAGVPASELPPVQLLAAWPSILDGFRRLHGLPVGSCPFERRLATMFRLAAEVVAHRAVNPAWLRPGQRGRPPESLLDELRAQLPERLADEQRDLVVCHGDACLPNVIVDPDTMTCAGLVDLGRLGAADRHADLSLLRANAGDEVWADDPSCRSRADALFEAVYGPGLLDPARLRFYLHLDPLTWWAGGDPAQ